jgi:two-component sensor histidine kinase
MRILVIDDNPDDRELVLREVEALFPEAEVVQPTNIAEFEAALNAGEPDLVVTDLDLRWSSGHLTLASVKQRYPHCPVVMFTGTGDEETAVELMKAGLDDYVVKSPRQLPRLKISLKMVMEMASSRSALSNREAQLTAMVAHRDMVVRELHHRVKNNLQTIISLLSLTGRGADDGARACLDAASQRMQALATVQAKIYEVGSLEETDFCAALREIAETLVGVYDGFRIELLCDFGGPLDLAVERAMPLGLLCYEIILNACKHAWPDRSGGKLVIEVHTEQLPPVLVIRDDGIGYNTADVEPGLGTRLIRSLAGEARVQIEKVSDLGVGTIVTLTLV